MGWSKTGGRQGGRKIKREQARERRMVTGRNLQGNYRHYLLQSQQTQLATGNFSYYEKLNCLPKAKLNSTAADFNLSFGSNYISPSVENISSNQRAVLQLWSPQTDRQAHKIILNRFHFNNELSHIWYYSILYKYNAVKS